LGWSGPVHTVSSVSRAGLHGLVQALAEYLEILRVAEDPGRKLDEEKPYDPLDS